MSSTFDHGAKDADYALAESRRLYEGGDLNAAERTVQASLANFSDHEALWHLSALIAAARANYGIARKQLERSLSLGPRSAEKWSNLASITLRQGDLDFALLAADNALTIDSEHVPARCNMAEILILKGKPIDALQHAELALAANRCFANAWAVRGWALSDLNRIPESLYALEHALKLSPANPSIHNNRGVALAKLNQQEAALRCHERALELEPLFHDARVNLARNLADLGHHDRALQQLSIVLQSQPMHAEARFNMARTLLEMGRFTDGWIEFEWRFESPSCSTRRLPSLRPEWDGTPTSQPVLVYPEQGVGDQILFCSMLTDARMLAPNLIVAFTHALSHHLVGA
jgi:tetratricopeptide (TPR) repeat protein